MIFRKERKRYMQGFGLRCILNGIFLTGLVGAILLGMHLSSWIPLAIVAALVAIAEALLWYDAVYGWPSDDLVDEPK